MRNTFIYTVLAILMWPVGVVAQQVPQLSARAEVSLLSSQPGYYIYEAYGHSSLRIHDPETGIDLDYNFGSFDFFQENFYFNFLKGYMRYYLGVREYYKVENNFLRQGLAVRAQVLNLTQAEKQALFERLERNRLPENKYYYYDYFYDNCATRWRDILQEVLGPKLHFNYPQPDTVLTIRNLMHRYTDLHQWGQFGIDLALGATIDRPVGYREATYLPDYLEEVLDSATLHADSVAPLVLRKVQLVFPPVPLQKQAEAFTPVEVGWLVLAFVLVFSLWDWFRRKLSTGLDVILLLLAGISGGLLVFFWFFTNHATAANNYNLLWAVPTHAVVAVLLPWLGGRKWVAWYFAGTAVVLALLLLTWGFLPQDLPEAMVPLVFVLFLRSSMRYLRSAHVAPALRRFVA